MNLTWIEVVTWIWANAWKIVALYAVIRYHKVIYEKFIFTPLAGGNGVIKMDEMAKGVILVVFVLSTYEESTRKHEYHVFSDAYYLTLLGTVAIIAGIKHGVELIRQKNKSPEDTPKAP